MSDKARTCAGLFIGRLEVSVMRTIEEVEKELGWTESEASNCGCNMRDEPCERCWSLGWALGGEDIIRSESKSIIVIGIGK